jgi:sugar phosphate isomerase/epimerase
MRLACSYVGNYGKTFAEFVSAVDVKLFSGVELIPDQFPNLYSDLSGSRAKTTIDELRRRNLIALFHNVFYDINLVSLVPEIQDFAFTITEKVFRIAQEFESPAVTIHPGYMFSGWRSDSSQSCRFWESAEKAMSRLGKLGKKYGIRPLLENGSYYVTTASGSPPKPLHIGITPEELAKLVRAGGSDIGVCLDFGKMVASTHPLQEFLKCVGSAIEQIQASVIVANKGDWAQLVSHMTHQQKEFWIVLEGPTQSRRDQARLIASLSQE